jgi:hypothetical protein
MESIAYQFSDFTTLSLLREKHRGCHPFYHKYAPLMYGLICTYTFETGIAENFYYDIYTEWRRTDFAKNKFSIMCMGA